MTAEAARRSGQHELEGPWLPPDSGGQLADSSVQHEVQTFLAIEAEAYDDRRYDDWLAMTETGFSYRIPVPVVRDNPFDLTYDPSALLMDETRESLADTWFARFGPGVYDVAWGEHPPPRFRHFISNIRVRQTATDRLYLARSNVSLIIVRHAHHQGQLTGERFDLIRSGPDGWRLASRYAVLDQVTLAAPQLRVML